MSTARQPLDRTFTTGESVPYSGVYSVRRHSACMPRAVVLLHSDIFPPCAACGADGVFELRERVPHINEDPDFTHSEE